MNTDEIRSRLFALQDVKYRDFQSGLIPNIPPETVIGVRVPELRKLAKEIGADEAFLAELPHEYYDENLLHALIITGIKDKQECLRRTVEFLPFVDNWAVCDVLSLKCFKSSPEELLPDIRRWIASDQTYTIRFGVGCLMEFFLDEHFKPEYPEIVSKIRSDEYYVNMMIAWYFATALAKRYEAVLPYIEQRRLGDWVHRKTIQKAIESYRVSDEHKQYLRTLR